MKRFLTDLGLGARVLRRSPAFALTATLALGLGTGAATAIFTVLDAVVLRPLPYPAAEQLVMLWDINHEKALEHEPISPVTFLDYRGLTQVFSDAAAWWRPEMTLVQPGLDPLRVDAVEASRNLFDVVGVHPQLGRGFPFEGPLHERGVQEVIISNRLWRARFGADPALVGQSISLSGELFTVVGVMSPGFNFPGQTDVWQRLRWDLAQHSRGAHFMEAVARLAPGTTADTADRELNAVSWRLGKEFPPTNAGWSARATPLLDEVVGYFRPALFVLMASVALLLLIACVNVANLLLARTATRAKEVALRAAIGASRGRIVGQFLAESLLLAAGGTVLGLLIAWSGVKLLRAASPISIPRLEGAGVDARVLLFSVALAILTTIVFGLAPALLASRADLQQALREGGRGIGGGGARRMRQALVIGEVALSVALLVAAGLVTRSVDRLVREDPGLKPDNILTASLNLPSNAYRDWTEVARFYEGVTDALRRQPGVEAATTSNFLPLATGWRIPLEIEGRPPIAAAERPQVQYHTVGTEYFRTLGVPLVAGRTFDAHDTLDSRGVVLVNDAMARRFWPDGGAIGAKVRALTKYIGPLGVRLADSDEYEVVGIVGNVKNSSLQREAEPAMYFSIYQFPFREMYVQIRGRATPETLLTALRREVRARDAALPISKVRTMEGVLGESIARPKFLVALMAGFAALALTLAAVGIYGILAYAVTERTREIGIRVALGARGASVVWLVVRQGLALSGLGVVFGALAAYFGGQILSAVLYDVQPADPVTSAVVLGLVVAVSLVACWVPAHRAARLDPLVALRQE